MAASASQSDEHNDSPHRYLPLPFSTSPPSAFTLITQGAEALLYRANFLVSSSHPTSGSVRKDKRNISDGDSITTDADTTDGRGNAALKIRPPKPWRHPILDKRLTRQRILAESRVLVKCRKEGVPVPAVLGMSWEEGWLALEWVGEMSVKEWLRRRSATKRAGEVDGTEEGAVKRLLQNIGRVVGKLHAIGVVHGDLTTSNMMLRSIPTMPPSTGLGGGEEMPEIVLIDFGLATQSVQEEDRAVDLYVLERAFGSTHPREEGTFGLVLDAYRDSYKDGKRVLRRLEDVRMRGRKKSMVG